MQLTPSLDRGDGKLTIAAQRKYVLFFFGVIMLYEVGYNTMMSRVMQSHDEADLQCGAGGETSPYCAEVNLFREWHQVGQREAAIAIVKEEMDLKMLLHEEEEEQHQQTSPQEQNDTTVGTTAEAPFQQYKSSLTDARALVARLTDREAVMGDLSGLDRVSDELIRLPTFEALANETSPEVEGLKSNLTDFTTDLLGNFTEIVEKLAERARKNKEEASKWRKERSQNTRGASSRSGMTAWARSLEDSMAEMEAKKRKMHEDRQPLGKRITALHLELCMEPHRWNYPSCPDILAAHGYKVVNGNLQNMEDSTDVVIGSVSDREEDEVDWRTKAEESRRKLCEQPNHEDFPECVHPAATSTESIEADVPAQAAGALRGAEKRMISWRSVKQASKWWTSSEQKALDKADLVHTSWTGALPKVVCVSVIPSGHSARYRLKYFVNAFRLQTYEGPRELVLVYHVGDEEAAELVNRYADGFYIRGVAAQGNETLPSTVAFRYGAWAASEQTFNDGESASPDVIAQWDFEAWHHPDRLKMQVRSLAHAARPVGVLFPQREPSKEADAPDADAERTNASSASKLTEGSIVGEVEWMRQHWYPLLQDSSILQGKEANRVVKVIMPELLKYTTY